MNILMIANLRSGLGDPGLYDFVRTLGEHGAEVTLRFLRESEDLAHLLRDASGYDRVVAAAEMAPSHRSSMRCAIRASPDAVSRRNSQSHRAQPAMPVEPIYLAHLALEGIPVALDIGELDIDQGVGFLMIAGAGFDADLVERPASTSH